MSSSRPHSGQEHGGCLTSVPQIGHRNRTVGLTAASKSPPISDATNQAESSFRSLVVWTIWPLRTMSSTWLGVNGPRASSPDWTNHCVMIRFLAEVVVRMSGRRKARRRGINGESPLRQRNVSLAASDRSSGNQITRPLGPSDFYPASMYGKGNRFIDPSGMPAFREAHSTSFEYAGCGVCVPCAERRRSGRRPL